MLKVVCPRCGNEHFADESHLGRLLRCSRCEAAVPIVAQNDPAARVVPDGSAAGRASSAELVRGWLARVWATLTSGVRAVRLPRRFAVPALAALGVGLLLWSGWRGHWFTAANAATGGSGVAAEGVSHAALEPDRLTTGLRITPDAPMNGHGVLTIENDSARDAVVKVNRVPTRYLISEVYVQHGTSVELRDMDEGIYAVRFTSGSGWNRLRQRFGEDASYFRLSKTLEIEQRDGDEGERYSHLRVKLAGVSGDGQGGAVERADISEEAFRR